MTKNSNSKNSNPKNSNSLILRNSDIYNNNMIKPKDKEFSCVRISIDDVYQICNELGYNINELNAVTLAYDFASSYDIDFGFWEQLENYIKDNIDTYNITEMELT